MSSFFSASAFESCGVTAEQARQAFAPGGIDENMEGIFALLENALASPPHNHAVANFRRLFNDPAGHLGGDFGIKPLGHEGRRCNPSGPETARRASASRSNQGSGRSSNFSATWGSILAASAIFSTRQRSSSFHPRRPANNLGDPPAPASILSRYGHDAEHGLLLVLRVRLVASG